MTTVFLVILVLFSFFVLFSEGAQTTEEEKMKEIKANRAAFAARINYLVRQYAPQLTELRQLLGGRSLTVSAVFERREFWDWSGWPHFNDGDRVTYVTLVGFVCEVKCVQDWLNANLPAVRSFVPMSGNSWTFDLSNGLYAGMAKLHEHNLEDASHRRVVLGEIADYHHIVVESRIPYSAPLDFRAGRVQSCF